MFQSFSAQTKQELARIFPVKECCQRAELLGLLHSCGSLHLAGKERFRLAWESETAAIARKIFRLCRSCPGSDPVLSLFERRRPNRRRVFRVEVAETAVLLGWLHDRDTDGSPVQALQLIPASAARKNCCRHAFLRGAFLGFGSVSDPGKEHHLEMGPCQEHVRHFLVKCLERTGIKARLLQRRGSSWIYLKQSENIVTLLQATGANLAVLRYQDVRLLRDVRNRVNRIVNAETANLTKAVEAGLRQAEMIDIIVKRRGLDDLPGWLRQIAELRVNQPGASLRELGEMASPPLSKSRVQHGMRRLQNLADELKR